MKVPVPGLIEKIVLLKLAEFTAVSVSGDPAQMVYEVCDDAEIAKKQSNAKSSLRMMGKLLKKQQKSGLN